MRIKIKYLPTALFIFVLAFFYSSAVCYTAPKKAKYVFYFIGDGMGEAHVNLTEAYLSAIDGKIGIKKLTMSDFPVMGMQTTHAQNRYITCSAAAGTALATGSKTSINTISMSEDHRDTLYSLAYYAHKAGLKVGILSSVGINHATPAAFYAHQPHRNEYYEIALQLPKSGLDVFGGGGFINPTGNNTDTMPNAYTIAEQYGYKLLKTHEDLAKKNTNSGKFFMISPDILDEAEIPYAIDRSENIPDLADFTQKAIHLLENPNGFLLIAEGGKIDWAAHSNDAAAVVEEVIDFDNAIKKAVDFYNKHPDETLIIITADHETGGLTLGNNETRYESNFAILQNQKGSIDAFNNILADFIKENSMKALSFEKVLEIGNEFFGIEKNTLTGTEIQNLKTAYENFISKKESADLTYSSANDIGNVWLKVFNTRSGIGWTTYSHTGIPVPVRAMGIQASLFDGYYDNTDIPKKLAKAMSIKFSE